MTVRFRRYSLWVAMCFPLCATAGTISTADIVAHTSTAALSCVRWMPVGMCLWLRCSYYECSVETSLKVGHFQPDAVVSSYNELGVNPWTDIGSLLGAAQQSAANSALGSLQSVPVESAGNRTEGTSGRDHRNLIFRETDVIGHPVGLLSGMVSGSYWCETETTAFYPYFMSGVDALAWREPAPELYYPASSTPGLREIGHWPLQTWGGVYPRTGWTIQSEEPKAAAISAQRAGDIVTRDNQPHLYDQIEPTSSSDQKVWSPGALVEGDPATGEWQMLLPVAESTCAVFGTNDLTRATGWGAGRVDEEGDYAWTLWRPYQCCEKEGQFFLIDINWVDYPP